jgi:beta-lactamase class A
MASIVQDEPGTYSAAIIDPFTRRTWAFSSKPMRAASLIKLFIMVEVFENISAGHIDPEETVSFGESDRVNGAGLLQHLSAGTARTILELTDLMITESDNIATNLLIDRIGMESANSRIHHLGYTDTVLRRRMMDFDAAASGRENHTSVTDTARLLHRIHSANCIDKTADSAMIRILERQTDRCKIPLLLPPGTVCQHKTGELPGAEHDAGIIFSPTGPYVLSVMSDDLPDPERGCQVVAKLSRAVYDWFCLPV